MYQSSAYPRVNYGASQQNSYVGPSQYGYGPGPYVGPGSSGVMPSAALYGSPDGLEGVRPGLSAPGSVISNGPSGGMPPMKGPIGGGSGGVCGDYYKPGIQGAPKNPVAVSPNCKPQMLGR